MKRKCLMLVVLLGGCFGLLSSTALFAKTLTDTDHEKEWLSKYPKMEAFFDFRDAIRNDKYEDALKYICIHWDPPRKAEVTPETLKMLKENTPQIKFIKSGIPLHFREIVHDKPDNFTVLANWSFESPEELKAFVVENALPDKKEQAKAIPMEQIEKAFEETKKENLWITFLPVDGEWYYQPETNFWKYGK